MYQPSDYGYPQTNGPSDDSHSLPRTYCQFPKHLQPEHKWHAILGVTTQSLQRMCIRSEAFYGSCRLVPGLDAKPAGFRSFDTARATRGRRPCGQLRARIQARVFALEGLAIGVNRGLIVNRRIGRPCGYPPLYYPPVQPSRCLLDRPSGYPVSGTWPVAYWLAGSVHPMPLRSRQNAVIFPKLGLKATPRQFRTLACDYIQPTVTVEGIMAACLYASTRFDSVCAARN